MMLGRPKYIELSNQYLSLAPLRLRLLLESWKGINKSPGINQIPAELIQAGEETLRSEIHKLINYIWNKEEFSEQWKESIIVPIYKKGDKTDCSNYRGISLLSTS
jgi:hypothetical protein